MGGRNRISHIWVAVGSLDALMFMICASLILFSCRLPPLGFEIKQIGAPVGSHIHILFIPFPQLDH